MSERRPTAGGTLTVVAVLLAAGALGFLWQRLTAPAASTLRVASATPAAKTTSGPAPEAAAAPTPVAAAPERRVPESLPVFSLPGLDGVAHQLSDWRGHPLVVNFWATWCEPCRREIPLLEALSREHGHQGLEIIGIAIDYREPVEKYARRMGINYPVLLGEKGGLEAVASFGMDTALPFSVFADRQGRIVTLKVGELHRDEADLILGRIRALDQGRLGLADAREQIDAGIRRLAASRAGSAAVAAH